MSKGGEDTEVTPPPSQTPKVEGEEEDGKPRKKKGKPWHASSTHLLQGRAGTRRNGRQTHGREGTGPPEVESQLCPNKQYALEHITSHLQDSASRSVKWALEQMIIRSGPRWVITQQRTQNFWLKAGLFEARGMPFVHNCNPAWWPLCMLLIRVRRACFFQIIVSRNPTDAQIHSFVCPVAQSIAHAACHPTKLQYNLERPLTGPPLALCLVPLLLQGIEWGSHSVSFPPASVILRKAHFCRFCPEKLTLWVSVFSKGKNKKDIFFFPIWPVY